MKLALLVVLNRCAAVKYKTHVAPMMHARIKKVVQVQSIPAMAMRQSNTTILLLLLLSGGCRLQYSSNSEVQIRN